ncbi:MAG: tetratricopeptide repeat protein [Acidobacteria bacterium]|nr:tetratricopeptide repeat protein [Acidobacteriota bacterium]
MKAFRVLLFLVVLGSSTARGQVEVAIVFPFENNTRNPNLDWIGESFVETLSTNLSSSRLLLLSRRERATAFDRLGIPASNILSNATIYKVAQTLDVNQVILGNYNHSNGEIRVVAQVMSMAGPRLSEPFVERGPLANLLELQTSLAWQIQSHLWPNWNVSKDEYIRDRKGPRLDAFENYVRGVLAKERGPQIRYHRTASRLDPLFTKPAFELGRLYFHDKDYATSVLWLSKLRRGDPDYLEANYFLGLAYLHLEQYERATSAFRVVAQRLPLNEVYNNLGIALARQERPEALPYFEKAVQNDPNDPDFLFNLGYAYWKRGNCAQALPNLEESLQSSNSPAWRVIYIQCLRKMDQPKEAAHQSQLLQQESPEWTPDMDASRLQKLERVKDSRSDGASFRQLRILTQLQAELRHSKLSPAEHVNLHFQQAQQLLQEGFDREATEELQQVIDYFPEDPRPYRELAQIYAKGERLEEAIKFLHQCLQREESAEDYLFLARLYIQQGKLQEAETQLNAVLRLDPDNAAVASLREELNSKNSSRP